MRYDIRTIGDLIEAFGGPAELAKLIGISDSAVCNWETRDFIPPSWHLRLLCELRRREKTVDPAVFEATEEQFEVLFPSSARKSRQGNAAFA